MHDLRAPLQVTAASDEVSAIVRDWVARSLRAQPATLPDVEHGTVLIRTGGEWDSVVAAAHWDGTRLTPVIVFKNSVALWQSPRPLPDGLIDAAIWTWLRRSILIHNPGLEGLLCLLDPTVGTRRSTQA